MTRILATDTRATLELALRERLLAKRLGVAVNVAETADGFEVRLRRGGARSVGKITKAELARSPREFMDGLWRDVEAAIEKMSWPVLLGVVAWAPEPGASPTGWRPRLGQWLLDVAHKLAYRLGAR